MAGYLVDSLAEDFDPEAYEDSYREAVLELIERQGRGEEVASRPRRSPTRVPTCPPRSKRASGVAAMSRSMWSGSLSFGLVNVPVKLVSATRDPTYRFTELHAKDKVRIEQRRYCSKEDEDVVQEEVTHGYEVDGKQMVVTDEDLASVEPRKTRTIEIEAFVALADVDPTTSTTRTCCCRRRQRGHPARLPVARRGDGETERVALGRFVMRTKEYLAAVRAREGALLLTTMRFHDEVRATKPIPTGGKKPGEKAVRRGRRAGRGARHRVGPDELPRGVPRAPQARNRQQAQAAQDRGPEAETEPQPVPDLMDALQRAVENVRAGRDVRTPPESENGGDGELGELSRDELVKRAKEKEIPAAAECRRGSS